MKPLKYVKKKDFPEFLDEIIRVTPESVPFDAYARLTCQICGLWNRAILCPPLLQYTYPQYKTIISSKKHLRRFDDIYIYVYKTDGTKKIWCEKDDEKYAHIRRRKVTSGRQLKGMEAIGAKYLTNLMYRARTINSKRGYEVETFISGHCDIHGRKCPYRGNPPCKFGGLPSMEAIGINVYKLLKILGVSYEYPVTNYLTLVNMMAVKKK